MTLLVSKHLTHNQFKNYLTSVAKELKSRLQMFVVRPVDSLPVIFEVGKEKQTLHELGIRDQTEIVIFDNEIEIS